MRRLVLGGLLLLLLVSDLSFFFFFLCHFGYPPDPTLLDVKFLLDTLHHQTTEKIKPIIGLSFSFILVPLSFTRQPI